MISKPENSPQIVVPSGRVHRDHLAPESQAVVRFYNKRGTAERIPKEDLEIRPSKATRERCRSVTSDVALFLKRETTTAGSLHPFDTAKA